jgi:hypothetical protein
MNTVKFINSYKLFFIAALSIAVVLTSCKSSDAQDFKTMDLSGANQAPPVSTTGSGTLEGNYNTKTKVITLDLKWTLGNPNDTTTMGHIHKGAVGASGPVVIPFVGLPSGSTDQQYHFTSSPLTTEQEADLKAGSYYVNLHSNTNPGGELRAQLNLK